MATSKRHHLPILTTGKLYYFYFNWKINYIFNIIIHVFNLKSEKEFKCSYYYIIFFFHIITWISKTHTVAIQLLMVFCKYQSIIIPIVNYQMLKLHLKNPNYVFSYKIQIRFFYIINDDIIKRHRSVKFN